MPNSIENYVPLSAAEMMRRQAFIVWGFSSLAIFIWVFVIILAPIAEANSFNSISAPIYKFFGFLCHQIPERSLHLESHALAVCSRCFGVYFGLLFGFLIYPILRPIDTTEPLPRFWLFLALIPMGVDFSLNFFEIWENTHLSRFITGLILGTACAVFIVPAIVELRQLLSRKNQVKRLSR